MGKHWIIRAFIAITLAIFTLAGCSKNEEVVMQSQASQIQSDQITIAFAHKSNNSYFYTVINESVKRAVEGKGWNFECSVADYDATRQNQQIMQFLHKDVDAVITTAIDSNKMTEVVAKADELHIPIGTIDTVAETSGMTFEVCFDDFKAGQMAAEIIIKQLEVKYGKIKGTVFNAYGDQDSSAWRLRKEGFEDIMSQYPSIHYIGIDTKGQPKETKEETIKLLEQQDIVDAIHVSSEHPALGLVDALKETDYWYPVGNERHITVVTIDGGPCFVDYIKDGYLDAAIAQDVISYGTIAVDILEQYVFSGKPIVSGTSIIIDPYIIDRDNCNDKSHWAYIAENEWGFQYNK